MIYYEEVNKKQETVKWTWVTDLEVTAQNVNRIVKGARTRFKIENETFNTIKNQGYDFEHNYGHGYKTLNNVFAGLMLLSFLGPPPPTLSLTDSQYSESNRNLLSNNSSLDFQA